MPNKGASSKIEFIESQGTKHQAPTPMPIMDTTTDKCTEKL